MSHPIRTVYMLGLCLAGLMANSLAQEFSLPDASGVQHSRAAAAGKTLVIEFTDPDCPFVKKHYEAKKMQALQAKVKAEGGLWHSIYSGKVAEDKPAKSIGSQASAILFDPTMKVAQAYGAKKVPFVVVIRPDGHKIYSGPVDNDRGWGKIMPGTRNHLEESLDSMKAGTAAPTPSKVYGCSIR